jgi:hypothetical protein
MKNNFWLCSFLCSVTSFATIQGVFYHYGNNAWVSCEIWVQMSGTQSCTASCSLIMLYIRNVKYAEDTYNLEEWRKIAAWRKVFQSHSVIRDMFQDNFSRNTLSWLSNHYIHEKFIKTGSTRNDCAGNSKWPRSSQTHENIISVQEKLITSPRKTVPGLSLEANIP